MGPQQAPDSLTALDTAGPTNGILAMASGSRPETLNVALRDSSLGGCGSS